MRTCLAYLTVILAAAAVATGLAPAAAGTSISKAQPLAADVTDAINSVRAQAGSGSLATSGPLVRAARKQALSMAQLGYFSHSSPDGASAADRILSFYPAKARKKRPPVGETLFWWTGRVSAEKAISAWLASPSHHETMLKPRWKKAGVYALYVDGAPGAFGGRDVTIVVATYGVR